jgi:hypothetical protein
MPARYAFGWLSDPLEVADASFEIVVAQRFEEAVAIVRAAPTFTDSWFYPPSAATEGIQLPAGRFQLPSTHFITTLSRPYDPKFGEFLTLALGFLLGLRLTIEGIGHLIRTPTQRGKLVNFWSSKSDLLHGLAAITAFWDASDPQGRKLAFAAIHWYLTAQSYQRQYDEFIWQYAVLDNLHRVTWHKSATYRRCCPNEYGGHGQRPPCLSAEYGLPLPPIFTDTNTPAGGLIQLRNQLVHEALWVGEPLGYATDISAAHEMLTNLKHFNSQLILGILNIQSKFRNSLYDRNTYLLEVLK